MTPQRQDPVPEPTDAARIWQIYADEIGLPAAPAAPAGEAAPYRPEVTPRSRRRRPPIARSGRRVLLAAGVTAVVVVLALRPEMRRLVGWPAHRVPTTRAIPAKQPALAEAPRPVASAPSKTVEPPRVEESPRTITPSRANPAAPPVPATEPDATHPRDVATADVRPAYRITFDFDSERLSGESVRTLQKILIAMQTHPEWRFRIEGHTDASGTPEHNLALSHRRAAAAKQYLESAGIPKDRLSITAFGASHPLAARGDQPAFLNRRVEFYRR
jgi:outer membrane protein OmpA-like peptidoglycan-associated protein